MVNETLNKLAFKIPKNYFLEYSLVFIAIIYSAKSVTFFFNPISVIPPLLTLFWIYYLKNGKIFFNRRSRNVFITFFILMVLYIIKFSTFHPLWIIYLFSTVSMAFLVISILGVKFFIYYEKIVFQLAIISLVLFSIQLIYSPFVYSFVHFFEQLLHLKPPSDTYASILIYTYNQFGSEVTHNCGFTWEPGPYSIFLTFAIFFRFLINRMRIDSHIVVFIVAILSTVSTTGYLTLFIVLSWYFYNKSGNLFIILSPIILGLFLVIYMNTSFLGEKIEHQYTTAGPVVVSALQSERETAISVGRFSGVILNYLDFKNNPLLGYGGDKGTESINSQLGVRVGSTSGLGNWLAQFGLLGLGIFLMSWYKSIKRILNIFNKKGIIYIYAIMLVMSFAFNLLTSVLFFSIMLFTYFENTSVTQSIINKDENIIIRN